MNNHYIFLSFPSFSGSNEAKENIRRVILDE